MTSTDQTDRATGREELLVVRDAVRSFGDRRALDGASLTVAAGEIYALLGPNGAGKTSLVRSVCGRLRLDGGGVWIGGLDPFSGPAARRLLGLVPQEVALWSELTAEENLEILARLAGVARRDCRAAAARALGFVDLTDRRKSRVSTLSGGMQRRLNIAAGILHDPRVLLLDEPTVGVDPPARERIHELLVSLRSRGVALLLTTHDLDQAAALADRVGILVGGRIRAEGSVTGLVRETFGDARELAVSLAALPDAACVAHLGAEGLSPSPDRRFWSGPLAGGLDALAEVGRRLTQAGVALAEIRLREPDLAGVFFRVAGRGIDA